MEATITNHQDLEDQYQEGLITLDEMHSQMSLRNIEAMFDKKLRGIEECPQDAELQCMHISCKFARYWRANIHGIRVNPNS